LSAAASPAPAAPAAAPSPAAPNPHANDDPNIQPRFDYRTALDDKGAFKEKWTDTLPDHLKADAGILGKYPTLEAAMSGLVNAQKLVGQRADALKVPAPDAPQAEVDKYNAKVREALHIPADVKDYKIPDLDKLPEGVKLDDAKLAKFAELAHKGNVRPEVAKQFMDLYAQELQAMQQGGQAKLAEYVKSQATEIEQAWGGQKDANMQKALAAAQKLGLDVNAPELGNNAKFILAMHEVSKLMQPDTLIGKEVGALSSDAKAQADDMLHNKSNPWHNAYLGKEGAQRQQEAQQHRYRLLGYTQK